MVHLLGFSNGFKKTYNSFNPTNQDKNTIYSSYGSSYNIYVADRGVNTSGRTDLTY